MNLGKNLLILGAGNIGRGIIGSVFYEAGYDLSFYDASAPLTAGLKQQGFFTVNRRGSRQESVIVSGFHVIDTGDSHALRRQMVATNLMACCVYAGAFASLCTDIAQAIPQRMETDAGPLNILLCVNELGAAAYFKEHISQQLQSQAERDYFQAHVGLAQTLILRSGMPSGQDALTQDPYAVTTSLDEHLYVDAEAFHGTLDIPCMRFVGQMQARMQRKIYTGNMFHCIQAFLGAVQGCRDIPACRRKPGVLSDARAAYHEAEAALACKYHFSTEDRQQWDQEILGDLENAEGAGVPDPVSRVVARPMDKLARTNRFVAPALLCLKNGILPFYLAKGIACGLCYDDPAEPQSVRIQKIISESGIDGAITIVCGLTEADWVLSGLIKAHYQRQQKKEYSHEIKAF